MLEYLATRKEEIAHFIYKVIPLLSIDVDKKTIYKVINRYILKVSNISKVYAIFIHLADLILILLN
jgi:hypothetical protein